MKMSTLTERQERELSAWAYPCPVCRPFSHFMNVEMVFPLLTIPGSSVVSYKCGACGYQDDVLID